MSDEQERHSVTRGVTTWDDAALDYLSDSMVEGPPPPAGQAGVVRKWLRRKADARALCLWHEQQMSVVKWKHWEAPSGGNIYYAYLRCGHTAMYWHVNGAVILMGPAYDESHEVMWVPAKEWARLRRG